jgi:hypothetical protein
MQEEEDEVGSKPIKRRESLSTTNCRRGLRDLRAVLRRTDAGALFVLFNLLS